MSLNEAYPKLVPYRPPTRLISPPLLLSVVLNVFFSLALQICGFVLVQQQPWYSADNILRWESVGPSEHPPLSINLWQETPGLIRCRGLAMISGQRHLFHK